MCDSILYYLVKLKIFFPMYTQAASHFFSVVCAQRRIKSEKCRCEVISNPNVTQKYYCYFGLTLFGFGSDVIYKATLTRWTQVKKKKTHTSSLEIIFKKELNLDYLKQMNVHACPNLNVYNDREYCEDDVHVAQRVGAVGALVQHQRHAVPVRRLRRTSQAVGDQKVPILSLMCMLNQK